MRVRQSPEPASQVKVEAKDWIADLLSCGSLRDRESQFG
jgi:hypothetical protein